MSESVKPMISIDEIEDEELQNAAIQYIMHRTLPEENPRLIEELKTIKELAPLFKQQTQTQEELLKETAMQVAERIHQYLDSQEEKYTYSNLDPDGLEMVVGNKEGKVTAKLQLTIEPLKGNLRIYIPLLSCPEEYRMAMSEYIALLNDHILYGGFNINSNSGMVSFRYNTSYIGMLYVEETVNRYMDVAYHYVEQCTEDIVKIAYGKFGVQEKILLFEKMKKLASALSE